MCAVRARVSMTAKLRNCAARTLFTRAYTSALMLLGLRALCGRSLGNEFRERYLLEKWLPGRAVKDSVWVLTPKWNCK
jgi:hypothetical protein